MLDRLISLVAPHSCLGCDAQGAVLCDRCLGALPRMPSVCYYCGAASENFTTCAACRRHSRLSCVYVVAKYEGLYKDTVWKLKFGGARAAAKDMAGAMAPLISAEEDVLVVHIPTATSRIRTRGYDQARLLAREIARQTNSACISALVRLDQKRQVGASRKERLEQLSDAYRLAYGVNLRDKHILLVDDVLTTGATLETAASVLKKAGAKRVDAIVFARAV